MKPRMKKVTKISVFALIVVCLFELFNFIAQPIWSMGNYNPSYGFYEEPKNTIETLFLGSSHIKYGISPMELYEEYGICAYDASTDSQPVIASYYWLEEAYRLHSKTLDTVVLDVSMFAKHPSASSYHESIDPMHFSSVKLHAVKAYSEDFTDFLNNIVPLFSYHERWQELTDVDFLKIDYEPYVCLRGYTFSTSRWINNANDFAALSTPVRILNESEENAELDETAVEYFVKMVSFCEEHDINLLLIKTPTAWSSGLHNAVQKLADEYKLDFLDFNIEPYYSESGLNLVEDVIEPIDLTNLHLNYYGAMKVTDYLGEYLVENYGSRDVRVDEEYAFMEEELEDYHRYIEPVALQEYTDPCDYIGCALEQGDYTIIISVKDEAAGALTEEQRSYFASIGLKQLSELTYRASYLAVIENGEVVVELVQEDPGEETVNDTDIEDLLEYYGVLADGTTYTVQSGGYNLGNKSSIVINGTERSDNSRGLNIVIYDNQMERYVDTSSFDTCISSEREPQDIGQNLEDLLEGGASLASLDGSERTLYLYNRRCDSEKTVALAREAAGDDGVITYLEAFWDDEDIEIYITVQNDSLEGLTDEIRSELEELGLTELSEITNGNTYLGIVCGGEVVLEKQDADGADLTIVTDEYALLSVEDSEDTASVMIDGEEYSEGKDGISIVVYDKLTEMVIDSNTFDFTMDEDGGQ